MRNVFLVLKHELITTLSRTGFLIMGFGIPLIAVLLFSIISVVKQENNSPAEADQNDDVELNVEGYVDLAGIIKGLPDDVSPEFLLSFTSEAEANQALNNGEIEGFYLIPNEFGESGEFMYVSPDRTPLSADNQDWIMRWTLLVNMLDGDMDRASKIWNPLDLTIRNIAPLPEHDRFAEEDCTTPGYTCTSNVLVRVIPSIIVILFFIFLSNGSGQLLRSVTTEKQTRMVEILMLSISPQQIMAGKILGLGIAGLLQLIAWVASGFLILNTGQQTLSLPQEFSIPAATYFWWIIFFILGFLIYGSLMAGAGALVPSLKEVSSATMLMMIPLVLGYFIAITPIGQEAPHGALMTIMSMVPFTTPVLMVLRVTVGGVPTWQLLLAVAINLISTVIIIRSVGRLFRAQILLSGDSFSPKRFLRAILNAA